jgi:biopolymer transport protein ExbB/TolQ
MQVQSLSGPACRNAGMAPSARAATQGAGVYAARMLETIIAGAFGLLTAAIGYVLERRFGDRVEALEARVHALECEWHGEE